MFGGRKMTDDEHRIQQTLRRGTAQQVMGLRCPICRGPLRVEYCETKRGSHIRVTGVSSDFTMRMSGELVRPCWVEVLGSDFTTRPESAEQITGANHGQR